MWNVPSNELLDQIPRLYETEKTPADSKLIHLHFFIGGCDWFVSEYDGEDIFFGFTILNNDIMNAEWGYFSFSELKGLKIHGWMEIDCDLNWTIKPFSEIGRIKNLMEL